MIFFEFYKIVYKNSGKYYMLDSIGQSINIAVFIFIAYFNDVVPCITCAIIT
jgi:hypothetical protein